MTRVLLVEDSNDVLCVFQFELKALGYEVDAVSNAEDALVLAQQTTPDVIVSDLSMPGMDGFEFIKRIREIPALSSVPAIAVTGTNSDKVLKRALTLGFTAHVTKPVEMPVLSNRIEQLTSRRLQRKAS
jgi:two-component system, chemotaxis family, CheB/CheR fusion protein